MKVELINATPMPELNIYRAARTCYSDKTVDEIDEEFTEKKFKKMMRHLHTSGHWSVFEHITFTFRVDGITRQTTHQLVRHRVGWSYSQQSMRYVNMSDATFNVPEYFDNYNWFDELDEMFSMKDVLGYAYIDAMNSGVPQEDARRILPIGTETSIVFTANLRALMNFASVRRCILAQDEIREMTHAIRREVYKINPIFGRMLMIKCQRSGYCDEERNKGNKLCGIRPHLDSLGLKILEIVK